MSEDIEDYEPMETQKIVSAASLAKQLPPLVNASRNNKTSDDHRLFCARCTSDYEKMLLFPTSKDIPAEYWICKACNRKITIVERDQIYEDVRNAVKEKFALRQFEYDRKVDKWIIQSAEWIGEDRLPPNRRKMITPGERKQIVNEFMDLLRNELQIYVLNAKDFFAE